MTPPPSDATTPDAVSGMPPGLMTGVAAGEGAERAADFRLAQLQARLDELRAPHGPPAPQASDPVVLPGETPASVTDRVCAVVLRDHTPLWWWAALAGSGGLLGVGVLSVAWLFYRGVGIWGINWPIAWGFAILNYVWWIGIASGGTLISALFFLTRSEWRTSVNRIAESVTLCAAACAGIFPILHLGRPWFSYWLFPYPNTMTLWPQFRSPLVWDFFALLAYVVASVLFWYVGLLPDLASVRDRAVTRKRQWFYGVLALGFRGSGAEWRRYRATYGVLAAIMAPLVVSVHSIVGLDFAGGQSPGWHSTQFPPFFVFGAALSGFATVMLVLVPLRRLLRLEPYVTGRHLDVLGKLLLTTSLCVGYCYAMDAFSVFYGPDEADKTMFVERVTGLYAGVYWGTILFNVLLPQALWWARARTSAWLTLPVCLGVVYGMWLERYEIVVTSLHRPRLPSAWGDYAATLWDWALLAGTVGLFGTLFLLIVKLLPLVSMAEMRQMLEKRQGARHGGRQGAHPGAHPGAHEGARR